MNVDSAPRRRPVLTGIVGAVVVAGLTAAAARFSITLPHSPVPMTLQTVVVLCAAAFVGPAYGTLAMALYVGAAAIGLPVLEKGGAGFAAVTGPTAGYLLGFVLAPSVVGVVAGPRRSSFWRRAARFACGVGLGTVVILALGVAWLALGVGLGVSRAVEVGLAPFAGAALAKGALASVIGSAVDQLRSRRPST